ncbi:MAG: amino acid adenylation domain-containing protein [Umezawaea sp.]
MTEQLTTGQDVPVPTAGQEQIWFFDQLVQGATFHTVPLYVDISGPLDDSALTESLQAIVDRHEPLRTTFTATDSSPVPRVHTDVVVPVVRHDLSGLAPAERAARAEALVHNELAKPIDVGPAGSGVALRAVLLRLDPVTHRLALLVHHIATDGASFALLQEELLACYRAVVDGRVADLPELPARYRDVARWSREADGTDHLDAWLDDLSDLPEPLELPGARSRTATPDFAADHVPLVLPQPLADEVRALARQTRSSSFMLLLTAFALVLHRGTGSRDLVIGTPSAGREHAEALDLIGYFVNMLALRVRLDYDPTPREAVNVVRDTVLTALDRRATPFHRIIQELRPDRDIERHPVFQVVFASPPPLAGPAQAGGCTFTFSEGTSPQGLYDLEAQLPDSGSGDMVGWLKFRTALHRRADVLELVDRFLLVVRQLVATPDTHLSNLSLLDPAERKRIVHDLNANATDYPRDSTLPQLFEEVVDRHADEVAVEYDGRVLTYRGLDQRANQLAHHLRALGVSGGSPVGLFLVRGLDWVVAAVAVLKAGGAYLPLDPDYPADALAGLCQDSGVRVVLAGSTAPSLPDVEVVDLATVTGPTDRLERTDEPDELAYVMYTSGSTGRPKGVCVTHRNIVRLVRDTDYVSFEPGDRVAQGSTTTFDAATFEVWGALLNGGRLIGLPKDVALDPAALGTWLRGNEIDTLFLTTSLAMHVIREVPGAVAGLRHFVFGGEQPDTTALIGLAAQPDGPLNVVNGYGPTETTTFAASHRCNGLSSTDTRVPLGRALNNSQLYVLDGYLEPVPPGTVGELCIGGDGVARGYAGSVELTAERFVPDHLGGRLGTRLYRTGDLARLLPDGTFEFLGRADRQVKIRGFRIEPGEVENCLQTSGLVREAVVVPRGDGAGDVRLVGYVVLEPAAEGRIDDLMAHLREALPAYLVPAALVAMDVFPLTRNGKLDLRALPEPDRPVDEVEVREPTTPTERQLVELWRSVLGVESIGRDTNFFDLGGHSLKATRLVSRIAGEFSVDVPLRLLFDNPTIAGLAVEVDRLAPASAPAPVTAAARSGGSLADLLDAFDEPVAQPQNSEA